jgi:hypothetical protein
VTKTEHDITVEECLAVVKEENARQRANGCRSFCRRNPALACSEPGAYVLSALIALVTLLVAALVSPSIVVFFEVPLLGVVKVALVVILALAQALLVLLVFRIVLVARLFLW